MNLPRAFFRYRDDIVKELASNIHGSNLAMYDMMRYHMGWIDKQGYPQNAGGKLVRPTLLLLACECVGGEWRLALPAAAAVELVHNFSLIHDDIEDGDQERRQRATVWRVWGEPQAINVGDAMHAMARLALYCLNDKVKSPSKILQAANILDTTCLELCEGQYLDISYESTFDINIDDYMLMTDLKTASLITCSLKIGALLGTDDEAIVRRFERFGRKLGMAYQMIDDVLGIWGDETVSDIYRKKKTLPIVYALEQASDQDRVKLLEIYSKKNINQTDIRQVIHILNRLHAEKYSRDMAQECYISALRELGEEGLSRPKFRELVKVTDFLMDRKY